MIDPEILMRQAGFTASEWLNQAIEAVDKMNLTDEKAYAMVISAFLSAAASDQHTMTLRAIAESDNA